MEKNEKVVRQAFNYKKFSELPDDIQDALKLKRFCNSDYEAKNALPTIVFIEYYTRGQDLVRHIAELEQPQIFIGADSITDSERLLKDLLQQKNILEIEMKIYQP